MTIGPEPITSTRLISVRLGIRYAITKATTKGTKDAKVRLPLLHRLDELPEQVVRIVGAGRRFRMVLHREDRLRGMPETFDGPVVQVEMRHGDVRRQRVGIHREAMVLRGDFDFARL